MSPGEERDQFFLRRVDKLIDCFMGDEVSREIFGDPAGDKFRGPAEVYLSEHIIPDERIFQPRSCTGPLFSRQSFFVGPARVIVVGKGLAVTISPQFTGEGCVMNAQPSSDLAEGHSLEF
jgi:hypothetical protein